MSECHLSGFFCDDIRHEVGGKVSFIGAYSQKMLVQQFPVRLPKLCVHFEFTGPIDEMPAKVTFHMAHDDKELARAEIEIGRDASAAEQKKEAAKFTIRGGLTATVVDIKEATILKVVAETEGKRYDGPQLEVCVGGPPVQASAPSEPRH